MSDNMLREKIARAIDPTLGAENDWAAQSADRILALPEIADALKLRVAYLASMMDDLPPERVGEIMRKLSASPPA